MLVEMSLRSKCNSHAIILTRRIDDRLLLSDECTTAIFMVHCCTGLITFRRKGSFGYDEGHLFIVNLRARHSACQIPAGR